MASRGGDDDLLGSIARGPLDPIYCLYGPERYLVDQCLEALRSATLGTSAGTSLNHDVFEMRESGLGAALTAAQTLPMFAKRRLVVAKGIDEVKAEELEPLAAYVSDPNPTTCLVLVGDKIDGRLRTFTVLRKAGYLHEFPRLRDRELGGWIIREASARQITIEPNAVFALVEAAGSDLGRLAQSLEQLRLYVGSGEQRVRRSDVEELIAETRERGVFELMRAIGEGDVGRSLELLANMLRNREAPLKIQFMLMRQLRQIWRAKELAAAGVTRPQMASALGMPPFFLDDVLVPARRMSEAALRRSFHRLYQADRSLKSSRIAPEVQISRLVERLAREASPRA